MSASCLRLLRTCHSAIGQSLPSDDDVFQARGVEHAKAPFLDRDGVGRKHAILGLARHDAEPPPHLAQEGRCLAPLLALGQHTLLPLFHPGRQHLPNLQ